MSIASVIRSIFAHKSEPAERSFAAAQLNRLTDSWRITQQKIDDELRADLDALRNRSRTLENNNDFQRRYLDLVETNVIGESAPRLIPLADNAPGTPDTGARLAVLSGWAEWCQRGICEVTGQYSFTDLCQSIIRCTARDGEAIILPKYGKESGNRFGFSLQIIDVDRLATWMTRTASNGQNAIASGVEVNILGKPIAYHFVTGPLSSGNRSTERVDATRVLHRFIFQRPEQKRGIPWTHAAMLSMHYAGEFAMSALMAAKHGADHLGFFVTPDGTAPSIGDKSIDNNGQEDGSRISTTAPGTWDTLPEGVDVKNIESKYPNEVFGGFMKSAYQRMSSGLPGASYPELCNDYEAVNFSSIRASILSSRDEWKKRQKWFSSAWLEPIFDDWLTWSLANGALLLENGSALPSVKKTKFMAHGWQFRGWSWVDPLKDIQTAKEGIALRITSRTRIASEQGRDIEDVFDELQAEESLAKKYNINLAINPATPAQPDPAAQPTSGEKT